MSSLNPSPDDLAALVGAPVTHYRTKNGQGFAFTLPDGRKPCFWLSEGRRTTPEHIAHCLTRPPAC